MTGQLLFSSEPQTQNVVVILVGIFHDLAQHHLGIQLWVGTGKHFRYYRINSVCQEFVKEKLVLCPCSPFSGSDATSQFRAVKAKSQRGRHGKHIRLPLLGTPARLRKDCFPAAAVGCRELIKCGCKAEPICAKKCRCKTAGLTSTALCLCRGLCES